MSSYADKKPHSIKRAACRICTALLTAFLVLSTVPPVTAFAQTTGTADGVYDFGGLKNNDSGGIGYRALGDKFKLANGDYLIAGEGYTAFAPNSTDHDYHQYIYTEGGSVCKTFTFQNIGFSSFVDGVSFKNISLVFRDGYGDVIRQEDYGESLQNLSSAHAQQLSGLTGHGTWNIKSVASVEVIYNLQSGGSFADPCYLKFENITIANVSTIVNNPPEAHNVSIPSTYGAVIGSTLTGSYVYYDREGDIEGTTTFQWYRSDDQYGTNRSPITGATLQTYAVQQDDLGKWLSFEVTPVAQSGEPVGYPTESGRGLITSPKITVSFDAQGGSAASSQVKRYGWTYGTNGTLGFAEKLPTPSYTGFIFLGWFIHANGTSYPVTDSTVVTALTDITLYAHWTFEEYSVSYSGNGADGGSAPVDSDKYFYNQPLMVMNLGAAPMTKTGCSFTGWNTSADGSGTALKAGDIYIVKGNTTLYAQWSFNSYTVTLDAQGGTVSPDKVVKQYWSLWGYPPSLPYYPGPQRKGYSFSGWFTGPNETGDRITNMDAMLFPYDVTLYAGWEIKEPCIYLYTGSGGLHQVFRFYKRWGSTYGKAADGITSEPLPKPDPMKDYKFMGWYTDDGIHITNDTVVTVEDDQELTARWKSTRKQPPSAENPVGESLGNEGQTSEPGSAPGGVTEVSIGPLADQVLSELVYGYGGGAQETKTITLVRTGGGDIKNIAVSLGGADAGRFEITQPLKNALDSKAAQTTFTIRVKDGLPVGAFSATVTVSADDMKDETFTVTQTVTPPDTAAAQMAIVVYDGDSPVPDAEVIINGNELATDESGAVIFELAAGTYSYEITKDGYAYARGELAINESTDTACIMLQKQGRTVLRDEQSGEGVVLISDGGAVPDGAALSVRAAAPGSGDTAAVQVLDANNNIVALFDISLLNGSEQIQPGGAVRVGIPIPQGYGGQTLKIARINDDGTATMLDAVVIGDMLFFTADHFSRYAVISTAVSAAGAPPAGGSAWIIVLLSLLGLAVIAGGVLLVRVIKHKA